MTNQSAHLPARHGWLVRVTHWINAVGTFALIVSGVAILFAHPRLYWGETGGVGGPAWIELPIPFWMGHSGWGRYLHFTAAWICVLCGMVYVVCGVATGHFRRDFLQPSSYNSVQRISYTAVIFFLSPLVLLSGLAFSPALTSVMPWIVNMFSGQQSARTIHFFAGAAVVLFVIVHIIMACVTGFRKNMMSMTIGTSADTTKTP